MSRSTVLSFCFVVLSLLCWPGGAWAQEVRAPQDTQQAFYSWLNRYKDPGFEFKSENHSSGVSSGIRAASNPDKPWYSSGYHAINALTAWVRSRWTSTLPTQETAAESREGDESLTKTSGDNDSGFGCFYHRDYYTHLPMFKGNNYTLPGSSDASEVYWEEFSGSFSPAEASPAGEKQAR